MLKWNSISNLSTSLTIDYRRKYRVIERIGEVEFAGGMVGDADKTSTVENIESVAARSI